MITDDTGDNETIAQALHREILAAQARKAKPEEIRQLIQWAQEAIDQKTAADPERHRTASDQIGAMASTALDAATYGLGGIAAAAGSAALGQGSFQENRDAWAKNKSALPWQASVPSAIVGAVANPIGAFLGPVPKGAGLMRTLGKGAAEGLAQGGMTGIGENVGTSDDPTGIKHGVVSGVIGAPFGAAGAVAGRYLSRRGTDKIQEAATQRHEKALDADRSYTVPVVSQPGPQLPGVPEPRGIDVAGPTTMKEAQQAAKSIPGRQAIEPAFKEMEASLPSRTTEGFDYATGTTAADADALARQVAGLEQARDAANAAQKVAYTKQIESLKSAHKAAVEQAKVTAIPRALEIVKNEAGGEIPDATKILQETREARGAQAARDYPAAIDATKGQPAPPTPEAEAFLKTPTGASIWKMVQRERADVVGVDPSRALPEVVKETRRPSGFTPTQLGPNSALSKPETEIVPDAEAWHRMKQIASDIGKLDPEQQVEGVTAAHVHNVRGLLDTVMDQQAQPFRDADLPYAIRSSEMAATKLGAYPAKGNPAPSRLLNQSLTASESRVPEMTADEAQRFQQGRQHLVASLLRQGKSPEQIGRLLAIPDGDVSRIVTQAFGEGAPERLGAQFRGLKAPDLVLPPKPGDIPRTLGTEAALSGLRVTKTPTAPSPSAPEVSLPQLETQAAGMVPGVRANLQRGAAADFRGDLAAGKDLNLGTPERGRQFQFAAETPAKSEHMAMIERALKDISDRQNKVLSGSVELPRPTEGVGELAAKSITPSWGLSLARAGRQLYSHPFEAIIAREGAKDAAFNKMLLEDPGAIDRAIQALAAASAATNAKASALSAPAGRIGAAFYQP